MEYFKKISIIRDFLKDEFQTDEVSDTYDSDRFAQTFTIKEQSRIYLVSIRRRLIDNYKTEQLPHILKRKNIRDYFHNEDTKRVIIDTSDVSTEDE
jgi:hypothetical protein